MCILCLESRATRVTFFWIYRISREMLTGARKQNERKKKSKCNLSITFRRRLVKSDFGASGIGKTMA